MNRLLSCDYMGGEVVLSRWFQHLSGARYSINGMILHQLGEMGEWGAIDCGAGGLYRERKRFLSQVPMGGDEKTSSSMTTSI